MVQIQNLETVKVQLSTRYRQAVAAAARGEEIADDLPSTLAACGKGVGDFEKDVALVRERLEAIRDLTRAESIEEDARQARERHAALSAEYDSFRQSMKAETEARYRAVTEAYNRVASLSNDADALRRNASKTLRGTVPPEVTSRIRELRAEKETVAVKVNEALMILNEAKRLFNEELRFRLRSGSVAEHDERRHDRRVSAARVAYEAEAKRLEEIEAELAAAEAAIADPAIW